MSQESQELTVQPDELRAFSETLYRKVGVPRDHAETMANFQVETDLRGVYSHGTRAQPRYIQGILDGNINPTPRIEVVQEGPCTAVIDGDSALGHLPSEMAMKKAVEKAKSMGIAAVGVRNAGHFGAAACYGMMAVREKLIGFATTSTSMRSVGAPGGATPVVGNVAFCYALPAGKERPIVLDMACGISAWERIKTMSMYGIPIPMDWMLTEDGEPTNDFDLGEVLKPAAGPKGYGIAMALTTMAGPLIGGLMGCHKDGGASEHFFMALNVSSFTDYTEYTEEVDRGIRTVKASKTVEGVDEVYLPGEIEWRNYESSIENGIPLHRDHLSVLAEAAEELGVEIFWDPGEIDK